MLRQAVILVGGLGTRLGSLTQDTPKPMLPVAGEPFLDILLRNLARHGFEEVLLLARHGAQKIRDHYAAQPVNGVMVKVFEETEAAGTGGALREAAGKLDDVFLLSNGDSLFDFNYLALAQQFWAQDCMMAIALREVPDAARYGQVAMDDAGRVVSFNEKQGGGGRAGLINGGVYVVSRRILDDIGPGQISLETDVIPRLVERGAVQAAQFQGYFIDIGLPETYLQAQHDLPALERRKVVFFDRDGTLNHDAGYTHKTEDLVWLPDAAEVIRRCNDAGRLVIVLTNQSGVARGYYSLNQMQAFHREMNRQLQAQGAHIDGFFACPHHPEGTVAGLAVACDCRKPAAGLFEQANARFSLDLTDAVMIGDKPSDLAAAATFGIRGVLTNGLNLGQLFKDIAL